MCTSYSVPSGCNRPPSPFPKKRGTKGDAPTNPQGDKRIQQGTQTGTEKGTHGKVWKVEIQGKEITVIDPEWLSDDGIREVLNLKFGEARVGRVKHLAKK